MVGRPKSSGCRNCKRKKKGCDQKQPTCGQCERLGLACSYDPKEWRFVEAMSAVSAAIPQQRRWQFGGSSASAGGHVVLSRSLTRTALELQLDEEFWPRFMPQRSTFTVAVFESGATAAAWLPSLRYLAAQNSTVRLALNAAAFMTIGRLQDNEDMMRQGTSLYASALRETNRLLQHPTLYQSDAALASCRFLSMYETLRTDPGGPSSQSADWRNHVKGIARILELRGPEASAEVAGHQLFIDARTAAIVCAMVEKKPIQDVFVNPAWTSIPWRETPRNAKDWLSDVMSEIPELLGMQESLLDRLETMQTSDLASVFAQGRAILERCVATAERLRAWEHWVLGLYSEIHDEMQSHRQFHEVRPLALADVGIRAGYGFLDLASQYWFACVFFYGRVEIIHHALNLIAGRPSADSDDLTTVQPLPPWIDPEPFAASIAANAEHFVQTEAGIWGAMQVPVCLSAGFFYYAATNKMGSPEMDSLRKTLLSRMGKLFVMGFLRSLAGLSTPRVKDTSGNARDARHDEARTMQAQDWFGMDRVKTWSSSGVL